MSVCLNPILLQSRFLSGSIARKSHERFGLVESRSGAVTFMPFRFQIPLIKPDVRISRISAFGPRSIHAFAHGRLLVVFSNRTNPSVS